jgi:outer membrane protein OmpA-like peptidoglycan-associated protein
LSLARATYVRNHLVNQKVKSSVIYVQGVAARQPVTTKKTEKDQRANRRVEVYLLT